MAEHKQLSLELDSYELEEVYAHLRNSKEAQKLIRITIHGKNIFARALEPVVRIGNVLVQYPEVSMDERRIIGFLTEMPKEGAPIILEYDGRAVGWMREPFSVRKLKRL